MNIYHGKIISLDKYNNIYNYLVEDQGRIVYLGDSLPSEYSKNAFEFVKKYEWEKIFEEETKYYI